jgi:hypothetical protein
MEADAAAASTEFRAKVAQAETQELLRIRADYNASQRSPQERQQDEQALVRVALPTFRKSTDRARSR